MRKKEAFPRPWPLAVCVVRHYPVCCVIFSTLCNDDDGDILSILGDDNIDPFAILPTRLPECNDNIDVYQNVTSVYNMFTSANELKKTVQTLSFGAS